MIILQDLQGNKRQVPEGVPYRMLPGEQVIGSTQEAIKGELKSTLKQH